MDSLEKALETIASMPDLGSPWESDERRLANIRYWQISEFPNYLIFYKPVREGILIMRILHGARDIRNIL